MRFRADIEGLRGVAVLLVVLAHAGVPGFAGGFVGVDIFFVISGYLISGLLIDELESSGRIDYWHFYARRARRLVPALVLTSAVVAAFAVALVPADALQLQLRSAFWAVLWLSNMFFAASDFGYFSAGADESLFLHTWSLGVEEQFYLLWPLLLVLLWRRPSLRLPGLALVVVLSFAGSLWLRHVDAVAAYYLMPSRLWQLGLGGLAFLAARGAWCGDLRVRRYAGVAGVVLVTAAVLVIHPGSAYPGWLALLPTAGAALLLVAGARGDRDTAAARVLQSPLPQLFGRVSYSWYLWHWPALLLLPALGLGRPTAWQTLALVLASFVVAWLSHRFVEQPFRRQRHAVPRQTVAVSLLVLATLAALLHLAATSNRPRTTSPLPTTLEGRVFALITVPEVYLRRECDTWYRSADLVPCPIAGTGDGGRGTVVLIGDSIGTQWQPALKVVAERRGLRLVVLTKSSCPIVDEPISNYRIKRRFVECEQWRQQALAYVARERPALVVVGSSGDYDYTSAQWTDGSRRVLQQLAASAGRVAVLAPTPVLAFNAPRCIVSEGSDVGGLLRADGCAAPLAAVEKPAVHAALLEAVTAVPGTTLVTLDDLVCPDRRCAALQGGRLVYRDEQHLNGDYVEALGPELDRRLPPTAQAGR